MGLQIRDLGYTFQDNHVQALQQLNLDLEAGLIHGLLGENGAGKSTFARICCGHLGGWRGTITLDDQKIRPHTPGAALKLGLAMVAQHPHIVPELTVGDNILLGKAAFPGRSHRGRLASLKTFLDELGIPLDPLRPARGLDSAAMHWTAMAQVLANPLKWLLLDEPNAAFSQGESLEFYRLLAELAARGMGLVVITHRTREILDHGHRCHVLRHGQLAATFHRPFSGGARKLYHAMFGQEAGSSMVFSDAAPPPPVPVPPRDSPPRRLPRVSDAKTPIPSRGLGFRRLVLNPSPGRKLVLDADFPPAMIHGILGHQEGGLLALEERLARLDHPGLYFDGQTLSPGSRLMRGYIPSRRFQRGVVLGMDIDGNYRLRNRRLPQGFLEGSPARPGVPDLSQAIETMSGGMIQSLIIQRESHDPPPGLLVCCAPGFGLDQRALVSLRDHLAALARGGCTVLVLSSDVDEILLLCQTLGILEAPGLVDFQDCTQASRQACLSRLFAVQEGQLT